MNQYPGVVGRKLGMTQLVAADGTVSPCTVIEACAVVDGVEECQVAIQTNNVNIDDRGLIYAVDRAHTGLHIVELTGEAAAVVGL